MMLEEQGAPRRLFLALRFTDAERDELEGIACAAAARMRRGTPALRENLHLTLAFLGMCDARTEEAARLAGAAAAEAAGPVSETLGDLGSFSHRRSSVIWRGVSGESGLRGLQARIAAELKEQDVPFDDRPFVPHVTLVRGAAAQRGEDIDKILADLSEKLHPLSTHHAEVALMWSHHPEWSPLIYTPVARFPLLA
jgi:RNA 2',3'-cyclic 3'-phosphodiesterase